MAMAKRDVQQRNADAKKALNDVADLYLREGKPVPNKKEHTTQAISILKTEYPQENHPDTKQD